MATPTGQIGLSDVNIELGSPATTLITMDQANVRTLAGVPSGAISMQNLQGKSSGFSANLTISSNTNDYNMRSAAVSAGWNQSQDATVTVTINPGVYVGSSSTGTSAFQTGSPWPAGTKLTLINNGVIVGRGGNGGNGGIQTGPSKSPVATPGSPGGSGGPALSAARPITVTNNGTIGGGGGGGGGGGAGDRSGLVRPGGGGGGGIGGSSGGSPNGGSGTVSSAGSGGAGDSTAPNPGGPGGNGGGYGSSGSSGSPALPGQSGGGGGGPGAAVSGNPFITWPAFGTRSGPIS